jgi:hypothetical protein
MARKDDKPADQPAPLGSGYGPDGDGNLPDDNPEPGTVQFGRDVVARRKPDAAKEGE